MRACMHLVGRGVRARMHASVVGRGVRARMHPSVVGRGVRSRMHPSVVGRGVRARMHPSVVGRGVHARMHPSVVGRGVRARMHPSVWAGVCTRMHAHLLWAGVCTRMHAPVVGMGCAGAGAPVVGWVCFPIKSKRYAQIITRKQNKVMFSKTGPKQGTKHLTSIQLLLKKDGVGKCGSREVAKHNTCRPNEMRNELFTLQRRPRKRSFQT